AGANSGGPIDGTSVAGCGTTPLCHAQNVDMQATQAPEQATFGPGAVYDLDLSVFCPESDPTCPQPNPNAAAPKGGFAVSATAGAFQAGTGYQVKNTGSLREAKHNAAGNKQRAWTVLWQAPNDCATSSVTFSMSGNAVNGTGNNLDDAWNHAASVGVTKESANAAAPSASFVQPTSGIYVGNSSLPLPPPSPAILSGNVRLIVQATDDAGIQSVAVTDSLGPSITLSRELGDTTRFGAQYNTANKTPGPHTLTATATDCNGNTAVASVDVIVAR
ncbi:MAG: choice-of-anchor V domain-containing protein, partial [Candidatus Binatia bacterium]